MKASLALAVALLLAAGCERLDQVGKPPAFSNSGNAGAAPISAARAAIAVPPPVAPRRSYARSSLWNSGPDSLFGDRRAQFLGDLVTVVIEINDSAQINNSSTRSRSGSEGLGVPALAGIPQIVDRILPNGASSDNLAQLDSSSAYSGSGNVKRNESITLRVAATVVKVLPNGHFVVSGDQEVRVNNELRDLRVTGIVRPEDISRRNEITYDRIAGARIAYGGRGQISDVQQPRYGQQVADILLPF